MAADNWEQQQTLARQKQQEESMRFERQGLEFRLRSALDTLHDQDLRQRIDACLAIEPANLERLDQLWKEVIKDSALKTPEERLTPLLQSLKLYCAEEEIETCRQEALSILETSGFRAARQYVVAMHEHFRQRTKEIETSKSHDHPIVQ